MAFGGIKSGQHVPNNENNHCPHIVLTQSNSEHCKALIFNLHLLLTKLWEKMSLSQHFYCYTKLMCVFFPMSKEISFPLPNPKISKAKIRLDA